MAYSLITVAKMKWDNPVEGHSKWPVVILEVGCTGVCQSGSGLMTWILVTDMQTDGEMSFLLFDLLCKFIFY